MSSQPTGSGQLIPLPPPEADALTVSDQSQKAWHLFSLLLSLGRPAHLLELASLCTLFPAPPELIRFLCEIPYSPIQLRSGHCVTHSQTSIIAIRQLLSNSHLVDPPRPLRIEKAYYRKRKRSASEDDLLLLTKRRVNLYPEEGVDECSIWCLAGGIQDPCKKVHFLIGGDGITAERLERNFLGVRSELMQMLPLFANVAGHSTWQLRDAVDKEYQDGTRMNMQRVVVHNACKIEEISEQSIPEISRSVMAYQATDSAPIISRGALKDIVLSTEENKGEKGCLGRENFGESSSVATEKMNALFNEIGCMTYGNKSIALGTNKDGITAEAPQKGLCTGQGSSLREVEHPSPLPNISLLDRQRESESKKHEVKYDNVVPLMEGQENYPALECSPSQKPLLKPNANSRAVHGAGVSSRMRALYESLEQKKAASAPREKQQNRTQKLINADRKLKHANTAISGQEKRDNSAAASSKDQAQVKVLPNLESYVVEEEEGSGGYGTVYRAHRRKDGRIVAIKYPHAKAQEHHIVNELKMLERFGGKNFIIKYEGCFKSGNADCFVLEHVEHDRPEVLKKEIDILQLQWYAYCLFRALASLHKQGVVHRDVKPGNFLFSHKTNKGYLIDFNLAMDLHQKHATKNKLKLGCNGSFDPLPLSNAKPLSPSKMKFHGVRSLGAVRKDEIKVSKLRLEAKSLKRKSMDQTKAGNDVGSWNTVRSQGAEGSGVTSARDVTSTRTASAERMREPLPRQGRKELISLLQKTMHTNSEASSVPAPMRKRIAAPPAKIDDKLLIITPMPVHSTGIPVCGAGFRSSKGDHKKEGPCVGTKGFRAPEVLFRSPHQGPKLDVWSAGVTLLYLVIGKMPFLGDPEQNIKDIAKLRGSEDLWEVAKLHNRELSFPVDLYDAQHLMATNLRDWCRRNTRRPDFLEVVPSSFFDLLDKCLSVNPRLRITAEEALKHEFFVPCHEELRKQKLLRRDYPLEPEISHPIHRYKTNLLPTAEI
ncbi:uncharacterized protein LOC116200699 [Punica granatum]|uniref:non-specific serine/threonine protein kinase n=1 Tax=Punica granatum TaxID=22663 RepID=A0A6P8CU62_PUNGR|nr:uncharacterized protein LOC116200699 [Punica granatum]